MLGSLKFLVAGHLKTWNPKPNPSQIERRPGRAKCQRSPYKRFGFASSIAALALSLMSFRLASSRPGEALAITVGHVRAEHHLALARQLDNLRQQHILHFSAEVEIALLQILRGRKPGLGNRLSKDRGKIPLRMFEAMLQPFRHEVYPLAAGLEKSHAQFGKLVEYAAANYGRVSHQHRQ